jgi:hypothetical protein
MSKSELRRSTYPWCVKEFVGWSNPTGGDLGIGEAREA